MSLLPRHVTAGTAAGKVVLHLFVDVIDDRLMQRALVAFKRQDIVGVPLDNLRRDRRLAAHRIDRNDGPRDVH